MRHCNNKGRLNRMTSHRKATLKSMANSLITYQRIETTHAKAKALRSFVEPLVTLAKKNKVSVAARRQAFKKLCDKTTVKILFDDIAPLFDKTNGGYTRILSLGNRKGDGAKTALIEFTKRTISDEDLLKEPKEKKEKETKKGKASDGTVKKKPAGKGGKSAKKTKNIEKNEVKSEEEVKELAGTQTSAPDISVEKKEEHFVEDKKKEKAKKEQKKIFQKGIFKRFRRKSI